MAGERSLEYVQNRTVWPSLGRAAGRSSPDFFEPSSPPHRHGSEGPSPCPPSGFTRGEVLGLSLCNDGCDLQCRRIKSPHDPQRVPGPFSLFGWRTVKCGGVCPAPSQSPGDSRGASRDLLPTPQQGVMYSSPPGHPPAKQASGARCPSPPPVAEYPRSPSPQSTNF